MRPRYCPIMRGLRLPALAPLALAVLALAALQGCSAQMPAQEATLRALATPPVARLTANGIGGLGAGSPYATEAFRQALPGFTFETVKTMGEGDLQWLTAAFKDGSQQLQFAPDRSRRKIASIHVVGLEAAGPDGERLGMTFSETNASRLDCRAGTEEWAGMAVCATADGVLSFVYAPDSYDGVTDRLPPRSELSKARLVRIVWRAPPEPPRGS